MKTIFDFKVSKGYPETADLIMKIRQSAIEDVKQLRKEKLRIETSMEDWGRSSNTYNILNIDLWKVIATVSYIMEKNCLSESDLQ